MNTTDEIIYVPLTKIVANRYQPRQSMDPEKLQKLVDSIRVNQMLQKPSARLLEDGCYELAFGHRRFEAYKILAASFAEYRTMPLIVRELNDEQMFDLAWDENDEREDLNPIEEGEAYATYMREFNKTSKEAGVRFGVSEESIRSKTRLPNLPLAAQQALKERRINIDTARALLSMQKIASPEEITATVNRIEKSRGQRLPEQVIEHAIERLDHVVEMWDENNRDGKPRSGYGSLSWLLDMKKFPNQLLPNLEADEAMLAVGLQGKDMKREVSAFVMLAQTMQGQSVAEVETGLEPNMTAKISHMVNPPACTACRFYTRVRGSHYCGMKACHTRKTAAWSIQQLEQTIKSTGIALYTESDGRYAVLESYNTKNTDMFNKRHPSLRLMPKSQLDGHYYQSFKGVDSNVCYVVSTGSTIEKLDSYGSKGRGGKKTEKEKAEMRAMKIYRARRKELMWEFTGAAKSMLENLPEPVLEKLNRWNNIMMDDSIPEDLRKASDSKGAEYQRRALVWRLIMGSSSHFRRQSLVKQLADFQKLIQIKLPKELLKHAQEWDAQIDTVAKGGAK